MRHDARSNVVKRLATNLTKYIPVSLNITASVITRAHSILVVLTLYIEKSNIQLKTRTFITAAAHLCPFHGIFMVMLGSEQLGKYSCFSGLLHWAIGQDCCFLLLTLYPLVTIIILIYSNSSLKSVSELVDTSGHSWCISHIRQQLL